MPPLRGRGSDVLAFASPLLMLGIIFSCFTCLSIPCDEDCPVVACSPCYKRRRQFVRALGVDESHVQTKLITFFCYPCSEVQQWRELRNSGIWPGLMLCSAGAEDREAMEASAVRARYSVDGHYGIRAARGAGPLAQRTASLIDAFPGPKVGIMQ